MKKLSIIIPLYNSAKYIRKCLDSVLNQDLPSSQYELIVVDDESPDNSYNIVLEYTKIYDNIKLLSQKNQGTSGARNTGIMEAVGRYICFVDQDDFIEPNVFSILLRKMEEENLDLLRFRHRMMDETWEEIPMPKSSKNDAIFDNEIVNGKEFLSYKLSYACYCWAFIYKTSVIKKNEIYFTPGVYLDDTDWLPQILYRAKRVTSIDLNVYNYVQWNGTLMRANGTSGIIKKIEGFFQIIEIIKNRYLGENKKIVKNWYKGMISIFVLSIYSEVVYNIYDQKEAYLNRIKKIDLFPLSIYRYCWRFKMKIILVNISPELYCRLLHYKNGEKDLIDK